MVTNENKNAFKIHKTLIDTGNEVIQLSIEHKIRNLRDIRNNVSYSSVSQFLETNYNNISQNRNYRNIPSKILNELKQKIRESYVNNSNRYPDYLSDFDITMKLAIARNLLNSSNSV